MARKLSALSAQSSDSDAFEDNKQFDVDEIDDDFIENTLAASLFDNFSSPSSHDVWVYMSRIFGFHLSDLKNKIAGFDDLKRLALTNYLRRRQLTKVSIETSVELERQFIANLPNMMEEWDKEENLIPVKIDDRLLFELPSDYEESDEEVVLSSSLMNRTQTELARHSMRAAKEEELRAEIIKLNEKIQNLQDLLCRDESLTVHQRFAIDKHVNGPRDLKQSIAANIDKSDEDRSVLKFTDEDKFYFDSYSFLTIHREMVLDEPRTSAFQKFILGAKSHVQGKVVLDLGCGSGILSMFCAQAGARFVLGVDAAEHTIKVAHQIVQKNHFSNQIQLVNCKLEDNEFWFESSALNKVIITPKGKSPGPNAIPFQCDVIVSEWMGYALLYEAMFCSVIEARDQYLKPDGLLIPSKAQMQICVADYSSTLSNYLDIWDSKLYGLDLSLLRPNSERYLSCPEVAIVPTDALCSEPVPFLELDLHQIRKKELQRIRQYFSVKFTGNATSLVLSFSCLFEASGVPTVTLETSPTQMPTHWRQTVCHLMTSGRERVKLLDQKDTVISGFITLAPGGNNSRHLSIVIELDKIKGSNGEILPPAVNVFELK